MDQTITHYESLLINKLHISFVERGVELHTSAFLLFRGKLQTALIDCQHSAKISRICQEVSDNTRLRWQQFHRLPIRRLPSPLLFAMNRDA
ncbi:MAG: hypothetical protein ACR2G4_12900 [Pyrinomonadaceae bacterium]